MHKNKKRVTASFIVKTLGNDKYQAILIPIFAVLLSLIVGSVVILMLGKNPIAAYLDILQGSGLLPKSQYAGSKNMLTTFLDLIDYCTPLIFASLSVAVALKAGMFNIGVPGVMLTSGFISTIIVGYSSASVVVGKGMTIVVGITVGICIGSFVGFLKYKFNINEVVMTVMLNYIAEYIISFFVISKYIDPISRQSITINEASSLTLHNVNIGKIKYNISLAIIIAIIVVILLRFVFEKTTFGYELKAVGLNKKAASYAGINVSRNIVAAFALSGALAGLAGVTYYLGYVTSIQIKSLPDLGFTAIAVAVLGNSNPWGIFLISLLISVLGKGSTYMTSSSGLDSEIAALITALVLLFSACGTVIKRRVARLKMELKEVESGADHS